METRSLKSRRWPLKALREDASLPLSACGDSRCSWLCGCLTPVPPAPSCGLLCASSPLLSLLRTFVNGFRANLGIPGWSPHKILNLITSAKTLLSNKITRSSSEWNISLVGGWGWLPYNPLQLNERSYSGNHGNTEERHPAPL